MSSELFRPITLRGVTARNRVRVAPMCGVDDEVTWVDQYARAARWP